MENKFKKRLEDIKKYLKKDVTLSVNDLYISINHDSSIIMSSNDTSISCGVYQIYSLPSDVDIDCVDKYTIKKYKYKFLEEAIKLSFDIFKYEYNSAFILLSNNNSIRSSIINKVLNSICTTKTLYRTNYNTNNKIKVWIY